MQSFRRNTTILIILCLLCCVTERIVAEEATINQLELINGIPNETTHHASSHTSIYRFPAGWMRSGIIWTSFPTLRSCEDNDKTNPNMIYNTLREIFEPCRLDRIDYKREGSLPEFITFMGEIWCGDLRELDPRHGYKFTMQRTHPTPYFIMVPGVLPPENLPIKLYARLSNEQKLPNNENWLGYFINKTVTAREAFIDELENLWSIQTQNWTMVREKMRPGSPWIIALQQGKEPTLSYGDMVIVKCFADASFHWNTEAVAQIPIEKELPSHYVYEEKPDYIPFYVELVSSDLPSELALYVDDVCKGAAVVCDSLVEIPGYIVDDINPDAEVEIRAYYADKAAVDQIPAFRVWNNTSGVYENKPLVLNRKNYYYKVKLATGEGETPVATVATMEIYPNPFNPSTTIRFSLPEATEMKLEVYNLKGQLVRTLAKGNADSGRQSVSWDGTDNQNRRVGSGLYYSKLSYQNKSLVQKMVMLK